MLGAVIGDIVGSRYEFRNIKSKQFSFFSGKCHFSDDSVMTLAIAEAIMACEGKYEQLGEKAVEYMQMIGRNYPNCGYGGRFYRWMFSTEPKPYGSYGNGAAMRVSAVAWAARSLKECIEMSRAVTEVTHDHPEGIKGAEAIAVCTYLALHGAGKEEIRKYVNTHYYPLDFTLDEIRDAYSFDVSCMGTVPQAIEAFLEAKNYEDAIRNAVSIGGDSDTLAACTGAIAEAFFGIPDLIRAEALSFLDEKLSDILIDFEDEYPPKITE